MEVIPPPTYLKAKRFSFSKFEDLTRTQGGRVLVFLRSNVSKEHHRAAAGTYAKLEGISNFEKIRRRSQERNGCCEHDTSGKTSLENMGNKSRIQILLTST